MHEHSSSEPLALLTEGAAALDLELAPATLEHLQIYLEELKLWNAKTNLTGAEDRPGHRHQALPGLPGGAAVAGRRRFPGGPGQRRRLPGDGAEAGPPPVGPHPGGVPPEKSRVSGVPGRPSPVDRRRGGPDPSHSPSWRKKGSPRSRPSSPGRPLSSIACWSWPRRSWPPEA